MQAIIVRSAVAAFALAAVLGAGPATAETVTLKSAMTSADQVPPNDSKGNGAAQLTYDTVTKKLDWTVNFKDLKGASTAAHFHGPAEPGKNAPVAIAIVPAGTTPTSSATGSATLTDAQAADLLAGKWYVNIHSAEHRGGEIRGMVSK